MPARVKNQCLIYLRRSSPGQKLSFRTQFDWAIAAAKAQGFTLDVTFGDVEYMQHNGLHSFKCLRLDDSISGAVLNRPGFLAMRQDVVNDRQKSHIFAYLRDRLARPQDAMEMARIELEIRRSGVTFILSSGIGAALEPGELDLGEELKLHVEYFQSGEFLRRLAERVIDAQRNLAAAGHRTGGNAPYGCIRILVDANGNELEELPRGRRVRQPGCFVRIRVHDAEKFLVWLRILELIHAGWGSKRIAKRLNDEAIPSPDAGRTRRDRGQAHLVSGKWSGRTVLELSRNPFPIGQQRFGQRSEGKHRRLSESGHRTLGKSDITEAGRERVVFNPPNVVIAADNGSDAKYDPDKWQEIQQITDERGKSQRGIPRTRDLAKYPLACRVFDLSDNCGSIMYARTLGKRPVYTCGRYMQFGECEHNQVDAEAMLKFALQLVSQYSKIDVERRERLRSLLMERALRGTNADNSSGLRASKQELMSRRERLLEEHETCGRRMAVENNDDRYAFLAKEFDRLSVALATAGENLAAAQEATEQIRRPEAEVDAALKLLDNLNSVLTDPNARAQLPSLFKQLQLRIGLMFIGVTKGKKRVVRQLTGGIVSFGASLAQEPESDLGALDRTLKSIAHCGEVSAQDDRAVCGLPQPFDRPEQLLSHQEGISYTKDNRGERI